MVRPTSDLSVDVVVVGGGLAALAAAVAARAEGAEVAVVVKRRLGQSGSSALTTAGYAAVVGAPDSPERHYHDTIVGGAGMGDEELVRILCAEGPLGVVDIETAGGAFLKTDDGAGYHIAASGDHSVARSLLAANRIGVDFTRPLARQAAAMGVHTLEHCMVVELLTDGGAVGGTVALDTKHDQVIVVRSPVTILATGGAGRMFPVTSNPHDVTGDGYALALRAGAVLRDMEFIQFYPWRCIDPFDGSRVAVQPETFPAGARLFNADGERFMSAYDPVRIEASTRDVSARAIFDQIRLGKGDRGGVRLDLSELSPDDLRLTNPKIWKEMARRGLDHRTYEFIVAPEAHYVMGGVEIDRDARTSVPGLFAAGEVSGGVQGANRLSNNALPEAMAFGKRAGRAAVAAARPTARGRAATGTVTSAVARRWASVGTGAAQQGTADQLRELRAAFQQQIGYSLGIVRDQPGLRAGLDGVARTRRDLGQLIPVGADALRAHAELEFMCDVAEASLRSALARTESRGAHYRADFPQQDDERWRATLRVHQANAALGPRSMVVRKAAVTSVAVKG